MHSTPNYSKERQMSDPTPPEAIEPQPTPGEDETGGGTQRPSPTTGTPPARVGGDSASEQQDLVKREEPEQDPSAHGPQGGDDTREEGKGALNRVPPEDAPRIVPEPGVNERDMQEHDLATHPDQLDDNPDGAGERPRPL
jgi:hypothetical protein